MSNSGKGGLITWTSPFPGICFEIAPEAASLLDDVQHLFIRHEYSQCFPIMRQAMAKAQAHSDWLLGGLILVMSGRCNAAHGEYGGAVFAFGKAIEWLSRVDNIGEEMSRTVQSMLDTTEVERHSYDQLVQLRLTCRRLCENRQFDDAADLCDYHLSHIPENAPNWYNTAIGVIDATILIARVNAGVGSEAPSMVATAADLLRDTERSVISNGHAGRWLQSRWICEARSSLEQLQDRLGL